MANVKHKRLSVREQELIVLALSEFRQEPEECRKLIDLIKSGLGITVHGY